MVLCMVLPSLVVYLYFFRCYCVFQKIVLNLTEKKRHIRLLSVSLLLLQKRDPFADYFHAGDISVTWKEKYLWRYGEEPYIAFGLVGFVILWFVAGLL